MFKELKICLKNVFWKETTDRKVSLQHEEHRGGEGTGAPGSSCWTQPQAQPVQKPSLAPRMPKARLHGVGLGPPEPFPWHYAGWISSWPEGRAGQTPSEDDASLRTEEPHSGQEASKTDGRTDGRSQCSIQLDPEAKASRRPQVGFLGLATLHLAEKGSAARESWGESMHLRPVESPESKCGEGDASARSSEYGACA